MLALLQLPLAAEPAEPGGRMMWFLAIAIILAIQHFFEKAKEKRAEEEMLRRGPDEDEDDDYEWEAEDEGYHEPKPAKEAIADFFRSVAGEQAGKHTPPPPPVVVQPVVERSRVATPVAPPSPILSLAEQEALAKLKKSGQTHLTHGRTHRQRLQSSTEHSALGKMLRNPASLRNAFILKEILEPPLAARDDEGPRSS